MANYKNPNGYGSVVKLSGKRRNPFAVRKTVGYDDRAYPIYSIVGYYPSRKDAMLALAQFNTKPYDVSRINISFKDLFKEWSDSEFPQMKDSSKSAHRASYKHCEALYFMPYRDIRKADMQRCIDNCGRSYATQQNIRNLFVQLDKYAYDNDIIEKAYSVNLRTGEKEVTIKRSLFTDKEVQKLHNHIGKECVDETLFLLYTGCRVTEMLSLTQDCIDYDQGIMRFGIKTAAGKNRVVPIHEKLLPILKAHTNHDIVFYNEKWSLCSKPKYVYAVFLRNWNAMLASLGMDHTTHDARHTVRSKLDSAEANKVCIDLIIGHKNSDIGERIYTHKTLDELKIALSKLSYGM